ncbi:restriction endonuclease subunit S [Erwinia pyrifoliae]|uniref:restriction endonuclease subunit S n=1 Tax=Erwinia pyrifoliae TaxID=79967 RepID=UPI00223C0607|nr:restriction endonuclease subunit S [Erwinia pyrifoliae]MCT2385564.1 restriction endonuclease subunit S [Erwinia pyrifoliae]MCU8588861.1 restriction endonuclease subunit S [Erwinia pyrifoliae]
MVNMAELPKYERYKDSGVDWLGEIPFSWTLKKVKHTAKINPPLRIEKKFLHENAYFLPMELVHISGRVDYEIQRPIGVLKQGFTSFKRNDVILAKITPCFENGKGAYLDTMPTEYGFGSTEFHVLRAENSFEPKFIYYLTKTDLFMKLGECLMTGSAGQKRVQTDFVANFIFAAPK